MTKRRMGAMVACTLWLLPGAALAQAQETASPAISGATVEEAEQPTGPSASLGLVWTNHYFFRGIVQETDGIILQPSLESGFTLYEGDGGLSSVGLTLGVWSSIHGEHPSNESGPAAWYEADFYAGVTFGLFEDLSLGVTYTAYTSPNNSFATVHELAGALSWDDAGLWERLGGGRFGGIQPSLTVARELDGTAFGSEEGTYLELGVAPSVTLVEGGPVALGVGVPITLGASLGDYYEDDTGDDGFGYLNAGVSVTAGLGFIPAQYGAWELSAGGSVLVLGDRLATANGDRGTELLAQAGLAVGY